MAEYRDVIKHFKRMCRYYNGSGACPLYCKGHGCNISHCRKLAFEDKKFASVVMSWAAEHPEPVYPTWEMYLAERMTAEMRDGKTHNPQSVEEYMSRTRIPADIAEKLGIEPKED